MRYMEENYFYLFAMSSTVDLEKRENIFKNPMLPVARVKPFTSADTYLG